MSVREMSSLPLVRCSVAGGLRHALIAVIAVKPVRSFITRIFDRCLIEWLRTSSFSHHPSKKLKSTNIMWCSSGVAVSIDFRPSNPTFVSSQP